MNMHYNNKNNNCFDTKEIVNDFKTHDNTQSNNYDDLSINDLKELLMKKDIEIARLKKEYIVKGDSMESKVYIPFSNKNMK